MTNRTDGTPDLGDRSDPDVADAVGRSVDALRRQVTPIEPDSLVRLARGHMDVRARRRRLTIRLVVYSGCAAVVVLMIVAVALRYVDRGPTHVTRFVLQTAPAGPTVVVEPASELTDGQKVQVTGQSFDSGSEVTYFQCMAAADLPGFGPTTVPGASPSRWICQGRLEANGTLAKVNAAATQTRGTNGSVSPTDRHDTQSTTPFTVAEAGDPLVSIATDGAISVQRWVLAADFTIPRCGSTQHADPPGGASTAPPAQPARTRPCVIVAVGAFHGAPTVVSSEALDFASTRPG